MLLPSPLLQPSPSLDLPRPGPGWSMRCRVRKRALSLKVRDQNNQLILWAKLRCRAEDIAALPGLLDTIARCSGHRLAIVLAADGRSVHSYKAVFIEEICDGLRDSPWATVSLDVPGWHTDDLCLLENI